MIIPLMIINAIIMGGILIAIYDGGQFTDRESRLNFSDKLLYV